MPAAAKPSAAWPPVTSYRVPVPLGVQFAGCDGLVVDAVSNDEFFTLFPLMKKVAVLALFVSSDSRMVFSGSTVTRAVCVPGLPCDGQTMLTFADAPAPEIGGLIDGSHIFCVTRMSDQCAPPSSERER